MNRSSRASILRFPQTLRQNCRGGVATLGNFDGVHIGHAHVVKRVLAIANKRPATVVSFYPHPINVLRGRSTIRYVTSIREKAELLGDLGISTVYFVHFTDKVAELSADEFIERVFVDALGIEDLVVGEDVAIGHEKQGNLEYLARRLPAFGIRLHVVERLDIGGQKAGSRRIRELVEEGLVEDVIPLLQHPFTISARVGHGDKRGSQLGFPTANIAVGHRLIPPRGVYACRVEVEGDLYDAVANIGVRPTFNGTEERLEVHILDFPGKSLYGRRINVSFVSRLRDEKEFHGIELLVKQIHIDIQQARARLNNER